MEMANTKKKPEYGDRMHNGNGRRESWYPILARCTSNWAGKHPTENSFLT